MNYACPHCSISLDQRKPKIAPADGQTKWLPLRVISSCPNCGQTLQLNPHPIEAKTSLFLILQTLVLSLSAYLLEDIRLFFASLMLSGIVELGLWFWSNKRLRTWPRYISKGG